MKCKLVKIPEFTGNKTTIYAVLMEDEEKTLFESFIEENKISYSSEIKDIVSRLITIGNKTGAREQFFRTKEGAPGDGVCALFDLPSYKLRLYCIRYGTQIVILGGGGPKNVQKLQQSKKLKDESYFLRDLSKTITEKLKNKELKFVDNGNKFEGDLEFDF
ncbi:MAG TPA: hypothetical protein DCW42_05360 [Bacteroidetes bacterium]|nr:hypothetical protein [Bacteroidota bacterium]